MPAPSMIRLVLAVFATTVVAGLLTECGGGSKDTSPTPTKSTPSASPSGPPTTTGGLSSALLTTTDLSTDWQPGAPGETFSPRTTFCGLTLPAELEPGESVSSTFSNRFNGFVLAQYLSRYEEGEATKVVAEYRQTIEPCKEWNVPAADGSQATYRVSVLPTNSFGDETFAFKVSMDVVLRASPVGRAVSFEMHIVLTRRGDVLNWLAYYGVPPEELALAETEGFAQLADSKLR